MSATGMFQELSGPFGIHRTGCNNNEESNPQQGDDCEKCSQQCEQVHDGFRALAAIELRIRNEKDNPEETDDDHEDQRKITAAEDPCLYSATPTIKNPPRIPNQVIHQNPTQRRKDFIFPRAAVPSERHF
jgi:hypothetical protein